MGLSFGSTTRKTDIMSHKYIFNANFHALLNQIDQEMAEQVRVQDCIYCGSKQLHQAHYPRSPFGISPELRMYYDKRLSFCCGNCRKRSTTPSVRFFGRRFFIGPLFIFISALILGINALRLAQIKRHFGITVSESTWKRWRRWWREIFPGTGFWQQGKGKIKPVSELNGGPFPRVLLDQLVGQMTEKISTLLKFLAPLTAGAFRAV